MYFLIPPPSPVLYPTTLPPPPRAGSPPFFVEVLHPDVHKGAGLERLCGAIGMPLSDVAAFGDGDNDIEFLATAGVGVAMANARPPLKAVADVVLERSNDEDGVAHALRELERDGSLALPAPRVVRAASRAGAGSGTPGAELAVKRVGASLVVPLREAVLWPGHPEKVRPQATCASPLRHPLRARVPGP